MSEPLVDLQLGDLFDLLPTIPENSLDSCVTDPPYGIGFMGKEWDTFKPGVEQKRIVENKQIESDNPNLKGRSRGPASSPSAVEYDRSLNGQRQFQAWTEKWAREIYRVLKPGAYFLVFGAPRSYHRMASGLEDAGFEVRDSLMWLFGQGFPKSLNLKGDWEGWGTALKPAFEPIALARKPFKGSLTSNVQQLGTGALNIDSCRIQMSQEDREFILKTARPNSAGQTHIGSVMNRPSAPTVNVHDEGRWPTHVLIDTEAGEILDRQVGKSVSRFFYCPKPSRRERDLGCDELELKQPGECVDRAEDSIGLKSPRAGAGRSGGGRNFHPTVKPVELMRYLVRLVTPPGGTVIDPFTGSGTTGMACRTEGFNFVGTEREPDYVLIALSRIFAVDPPAAEDAA